MGNRPIPLTLIGLLVVPHAQPWFGRGDISDVVHLQSQLSDIKRRNDRDVAVDGRQAAGIRDLKEGLEIAEEMARTELGLVRVDEIHVRIAR